MSERGNFRGRGGGGGGARGGRGGGERGRGGSGRGGGGHTQGTEKPKKENILDLTKYMDKEIMVKFNGGRESGWAPARCFVLGGWYCEINPLICIIGTVRGTLKGHDQLMNLVLDDVQEMLRGIYVPASILSPSFPISHRQSAVHLLTGTGYRRRRQHIHPLSWLDSGSRNTACTHKPTRW